MTKIFVFLMCVGASVTSAQTTLRDNRVRPDGRPVVIRTYDYTSISTYALALVWDEVRAIFEDAEIAVGWKRCPVTALIDTPANTHWCGQMLQPNEFVLRLLASSAASSAPTSPRRAHESLLVAA